MLGARSERETQPSMYLEGRRVLWESGDVRKILTAARMGNLPFFAVLLIGTWMLARPILGRDGAVRARARAVARRLALGPAVGSRARAAGPMGRP